MKKSVKYIILVVIVVVGFLGVKVLYDKLSKDYEPETGFVVEGSQATTETSAEGTTEAITTEATTEDKTTEQATTETSTEEAVTEETESTTGEQPAEGQVKVAEDFRMLDWDGNEITLYSKVGKPIIINFWASWCSPCKEEMADFQKVYDEYKDEVLFMMVNLTDNTSETVDIAKEFIETKGYTFPVYFDVYQEGEEKYEIMSIPTTYLVDAEGNLVARAQGKISYDVLMQGIDMIK